MTQACDKRGASKRGASIRDSGFGAWLCFLLGLVLLESWFIRMEARATVHLVTAPSGSAIAALAYRALTRRYRAAAGDAPASGRGGRGWAPAGLALLLAFGYGGALALRSGMVTLFGAFAVLACTLPWSRIKLCRRHILLPTALVIGSLVLALPRLDRLPHPLLLPLSVWMLWLAAVSAWLRNLYYRRRGPGAPTTGTACPAALDEG